MVKICISFWEEGKYCLVQVFWYSVTLLVLILCASSCWILIALSYYVVFGQWDDGRTDGEISVFFAYVIEIVKDELFWKKSVLNYSGWLGEGCDRCIYKVAILMSNTQLKFILLCYALYNDSLSTFSPFWFDWFTLYGL